MKEKSPYSIVLPLLLFTMLGFTAFFQIRWSLDLLTLEQQRRTIQLQENTIHMANLIKAELFPLQGISTQKFSKAESEVENYRLLSWVIYAHMERIQTKELFSALYSYEPETNILRKWTGSSLLPVPDDTNQIIAFVKLLIAQNTKSTNAGFFTMPNKNIILTEPISFNEKKAYIISVINADVFYKQLIPSIAKLVFENPDTYYFRIRDVKDNVDLFQYPTAIRSEIFEKPDFVCPLLPLGETTNIISKFKYTGRNKTTAETHIVTSAQEETIDFWNVKTLPGKTVKAPKEEEQFTITVRQPEQEQLLLEVVHQAGSLFLASLRYMMLNLVSALIVLFILGAGIGILLRNMRKAENLATRQQEFISSVTHELKTPLSIISSAGQNMNDGIITSNEKIKQYGSMIKRESMRLKSSIDYFLMYSRINAGAALKRTDCNISVLAKDVLSHWEQRCKDAGFLVETHFPDYSMTITCDETAILSVFENLISNAVKHAKDGKYLGVFITREPYPVKIGHHKIRSTGAANAVLVRIQDHGTGIPKEEQKSVFEPFVRGSHALNQQIEGSGVGLNLVKRILTLHGGTIVLESSNLQGSLFTIVLPEKGLTE